MLVYVGFYYYSVCTPIIAFCFYRKTMSVCVFQGWENKYVRTPKKQKIQGCPKSVHIVGFLMISR